MYSISVSILTILGLSIALVNSQDSTCKETPKRVCTHPKVGEIDFKWFQDNQPADGWHMEIGNSAVRLHLAELIQGKLLKYSDNYDDMCGRIRLEHTSGNIDGKLYGFGGKKSKYQCYPQKGGEGAVECDYSSVGLSKYADSSINYVTFNDNKNVVVSIFCFPNGENGWFSMSKTTSLSPAERKAVLEHVKSIGYDDTDVVTMYSESCKDNAVDASSFYTQRVRPESRRFRSRQRTRYSRNHRE